MNKRLKIDTKSSLLEATECRVRQIKENTKCNLILKLSPSSPHPQNNK